MGLIDVALPDVYAGMHTTSSSLLERLRQPIADEAWTRFVDLYTPLIYYWARGTGLSEHDAADLVQEVLTILVRKLPGFSYNPEKSFRGWLRTLTLNAWRKSAGKRASTARSCDDGLAEVAAPEDRSVFEEEEYRRHLVKRALELMQSQFEPTTWRACWSSVVEGRAAQEVALELGISRNAVYLAKSRVIRLLHQELEGLLD
jgi:RNA polymerase sigma-70 factor (ECF subfamily)